MRAQDLTVEVRNVALERLGQVLPADLVMSAKVRWCGVGEWKLTLPGDHVMVPHLRAPGSGLLVTWTNPDTLAHEVLFSGPTILPTKQRGVENPDGTFTFEGVTDEIHLADALAYPEPSNPDVGNQAVANDVQTGSTEALMRHFVDANIGLSAPVARRRGMLQYVELDGANSDRGVTATQRSPRFANLLETLQSLAVEGTLGFRLVQVDNKLKFQIRPVNDLRGTVRLDVNSGTLLSETVAAQGPTLTSAIVAGQGEGTDRTIIVRTTPEATAAETEWGRVPERFFDRRDTDDPLELYAKGDEELEAGRGGTSAKVVPADDSTMRFMVDWGVGDWFNVVVEGEEEETVVTEAVLLFDKDKSAVGAALGDVTTFDPRDVQARKQSQLDSRVGYLERATARLPLGTTGEPVSNWNTATDTGFYWSDNLAANRPADSNYLVGTVWRNKMDGFERVVQEVTIPSSVAQSDARGYQKWVRVGVWNSTTQTASWNAWRRTSVSGDWATKGGPTSNPGAPGGAYALAWAKSVDSGASLDADASTLGITIGETGTYEVHGRVRMVAANTYVTLALNGDRAALENRTTGMFDHDHSYGADQFSISNYVGTLNAGELVTCGPLAGAGGNVRLGSAPINGTLTVKRLS